MTKQYKVEVLAWGNLQQDYPVEHAAYVKAMDTLKAAVHADHPEAPLSWQRGSYGKTVDKTAKATAAPSFDPAMVAAFQAFMAAQGVKLPNGKGKHK